MNSYKLLVFDVDGTLTERDAPQLLPDAEAYFTNLAAEWPQGGGPAVALVGNQGGVGLRYWMETEEFGEPEEYPTQKQVEVRFRSLANQITRLYAEPAVYLSFAYQSRKGLWSPTPPGGSKDPRWSQAWRKPSPGMLYAAMADAGVSPGETLVVGNNEADRKAATTARCRFVHVNDFFERAGQQTGSRASRSGLSKFQMNAILVGGLFLVCCICPLVLGVIQQIIESNQ